MNGNLLGEIKKFHWEYYWSGNWPLLDAVFKTSPEFQKQFKAISGTTIRARIDIGSNRTMTVFHAKEEYDRLDKYFLKKFEKRPLFLKESARGYRTRVNKDLDSLKRIYQIKNLQLLSNYQLANLFRKARKHFIYNNAIDTYDWYMERVFTPLLEAALYKKLKRLNKLKFVADYLHALLSPHKISEIYKERQAFFRMVKKVRFNRKLALAVRSSPRAERLLTRHRALGKIIDKHLSRFNWMPVLVNNPPYSPETLFSELRGFVVYDKKLRVQSKRLGDNYDPRAVKKSKLIMKEIGPDRKLRLLIEGLREMAFLRTEDYWVMSKSAYFVMPLYEQIASRLGVSYYGLKEFMPEEVINYLRKGTKISRAEVSSRRKIACHISIGSRSYLCIGKLATEIKSFVEKRSSRIVNKQSVSGTSGYSGVSIGRAKIILSPRDLQSMKKGEIAVGIFMSSMFGPGLSKASGIVTEHGGLTSHPVIVAREFEIPCVVGAPNAAKIFKTGDLVEVDGNKGIIRLIKKAHR